MFQGQLLNRMQPNQYWVIATNCGLGVTIAIVIGLVVIRIIDPLLGCSSCTSHFNKRGSR